MIIFIITVYTLLQILLLYVSEHKDSKRYYVPVKVICSISFVGAAAAFALMSGNITPFYLMLPSLILCLLGDLYMGLYNQFHRKHQMLAGLLLFASAHVGYIWMLYRIHPVIALWDIILPAGGVIIILLFSSRLKLHFGKLRPAVIIYCIFVTELLAKSTHYMYSTGTRTAWYMGVGGMLFFLSDFLIIFLYFYHFHNRKYRAWVHYLNLLTYYYALLCFGLSIYYFSDTSCLTLARAFATGGRAIITSVMAASAPI